MKRYPHYKDSGVAWLGEVPQHWEVKRVKFMARIQNGRDYKEIISEDGYPVIGSGGVFACASQFLYDKESVLLGRKGTLDRPLYINEPFWTVDTMFYTEIFSDACAKYLYYCATTINFEQYATQTALPSMTQTEYGNMFFAVPPLSEQQTIAAWLDGKTAQIDALIRRKQTLLEKLAEKRSALISHTVTKGLNPSAPMKDSGVAWLGEVPQHWEVKRLKFLLSEPLKYGANEAAELTDTDLPRYIRITDVNEDGSLRDDTFRSLSNDIAEPYLLNEGDILLARSGATVGKTFIYRNFWGVAAYAGYLIRARIDNASSADFIYYFLQSDNYWQWLGSVFIQATIQNVSAEKYANLCIPVPLLPEQQAITAFLDRETARMDAQRQAIEAALAKLQEYRSALISHAVTGKIDIRSLATRKES